jgi:hypothetical protein
VSTVSGAPNVSVYLEGRSREFIIDTESSMCLIQPGTSRVEVNKTNKAPVGITGDELPLKGEQFIELTLGGKVFSIASAYAYCQPKRTAYWEQISCQPIAPGWTSPT